ncbi:MAG: LUD domain-containing protein, partial [Treponema sp.]|nr:LUD domain-containing protein [Treponema sp.]
MDINIDKLIGAFEKNNMAGFFVNNEVELLELLEKLMPNNSTVGCGDSVTLEQTGVFDFLRNGNYCFLDKHRNGITK